MVDFANVLGDTLARSLAAHLTVPAARQPTNEAPRQAPIKLPRPSSYDGKPKTSFRDWWKMVNHYFRFYTETRDAQRIAFVGALLTDEAKAWHLARDDLIMAERGHQDNWVAYSEAIVNEYTDPREGAAAYDKLRDLKYKGDIKAYLTVFTTLNRLAGSTGEPLQTIINEALPQDITTMRFNQNPRALTTDVDFLTATYEAGRHVETLKALTARVNAKTSGTPTPRKDKKDDKDGQGSGKGSGKAATGKEGKTGSKQTGKSGSGSKSEEPWTSQFTGDGRWGSKAEALKGVPKAEAAEYAKNPDNCWRCGDTGHKTYECYRHHTVKGSELPKAPWRSSAVQPTRKRARDDNDDNDNDKPPATKTQKIAAVEPMEVEQLVTPYPWEDSESDF
jgi:hypothetical protein